MKLHRSTIARAIFTAFFGVALFFVVTEHRAGGYGIWHYALLVLCLALLYVASWNEGRADGETERPGAAPRR